MHSGSRTRLRFPLVVALALHAPCSGLRWHAPPSHPHVLPGRAVRWSRLVGGRQHLGDGAAFRRHARAEVSSAQPSGEVAGTVRRAATPASRASGPARAAEHSPRPEHSPRRGCGSGTRRRAAGTGPGTEGRQRRPHPRPSLRPRPARHRREPIPCRQTSAEKPKDRTRQFSALSNDLVAAINAPARTRGTGFEAPARRDP